MATFKDFIASLDRDKQQTGFQIVSPQVQTKLQSFTQDLSNKFNQGVNRVQTSFRDNPQQYNVFNQMSQGRFDTGFKPLDTTGIYVGGILNNYTSGLARTALNTAKSGVKLTPGYQSYRAITNKPVTPRETLSNTANTGLNVLSLAYQLSPAAPALGMLFGGGKAIRKGEPVLDSALQGIGTQPGFGEVFSDNPKTQNILNTAYLIFNFTRPYAQKKLNELKLQTSEINQVSQTLGVKPNSSLDTISQAYKTKTINLAKKYGSIENIPQAERISLNNAFNILKKSTNLQRNIANVIKTKPTQTQPTIQGMLPAQAGISTPKYLSAKNIPISNNPQTIKIKPENEALIGFKEPEKPNIPSYTKQEVDEAKTLAVMNETENMKEWQNMVAKYIGKTQEAKTLGYETGSKLPKIDSKYNEEVIRALEGNKTDLPEGAKNYVENYRKENDLMFEDAKNNGININYWENHVAHLYKESPDVIAQKFNQAQEKYGFAKGRKFPTYEEAKEMGLEMKYTNPTQIIAKEREILEKTKAAINLIKEGKEKGFIVDAAVGKGTPGFEPIVARGFPKSAGRIGKDVAIVDSYYAPSAIAREINQIFAPENTGKIGKVFDITGKIASGYQNLRLSGGFPTTPINAFTLGQIQKEVLSGHILTPAKGVILSSVPNGDKIFFSNPKNLEALKEQQRLNVPIDTRMTPEYLSSKVTEAIKDKKLLPIISKIFSKIMDEPTFKKYMPITQTIKYMQIRDGLIKHGKSYEEATKIAAEGILNFTGQKPTNVSIKDTKIGRDIGKTFFMAPRYRESMVNFWWKNLKATTNPFSAKNINNTRFIVGATITYLIMNEMNKRYNNGRPMSENPKSRRDQLMIPLNDEKGTILVFPFLTSIGTMPRGLYRQGKMLLEGDFKGAFKDAIHTYPAMIYQPFIDIFANQDYFGNPVYEEGGIPKENYATVLQYLGAKALAHPYLSELFDPRHKGDPAYKRIIRALEIPIRFTDEKKVQGSYYYDAKDDAVKKLSKKEKDALEAIPTNKTGEKPDPNNALLRYQTYLTYPNVFEAKKMTELELSKKTGKPIDPLYLVDYETAKRYIRYQTLPRSSQDKKDMYKAYPEIGVLGELRDKYYKENPIEGKYEDNRPQASAEIQAAMDRGDWSFPGVREYLDAYREWVNEERKVLGLTPLEPYSWGSGSGGSKKVGGGSKKVSRGTISLSKLPQYKQHFGSGGSSPIKVQGRLTKLRIAKPTKKKYTLKVK